MPSAARMCSTNISISMPAPAAFVSSRARGARRAKNRCELLRIEGCAPDETAVDVRHREKLGRIAGLHAAAIQYLDVLRDRPVLVRQAAPDERMDGLRLTGRRRLARADRPYRLVCD